MSKVIMFYRFFFLMGCSKSAYYSQDKCYCTAAPELSKRLKHFLSLVGYPSCFILFRYGLFLAVGNKKRVLGHLNK